MLDQNKHEYFMQEAINEAYIGIQQNHGGPFGAVIVKDGVIIAKAHNEVIKNQDPTCHGEMMAIRQACNKLKTFDLSGCVIYTTGFPCPMCMGACKWAHIDCIYYGCNQEDAANIGFDDKKFYEWKLEAKCVSHEPCLKLFNDYVKKPDKSHY